jgi:hypothetical protein
MKMKTPKQRLLLMNKEIIGRKETLLSIQKRIQDISPILTVP